jgi:hypothetical protein
MHITRSIDLSIDKYFLQQQSPHSLDDTTGQNITGLSWLTFVSKCSNSTQSTHYSPSETLPVQVNTLCGGQLNMKNEVSRVHK